MPTGDVLKEAIKINSEISRNLKPSHGRNSRKCFYFVWRDSSNICDFIVDAWEEKAQKKALAINSLQQTAQFCISHVKASTWQHENMTVECSINTSHWASTIAAPLNVGGFSSPLMCCRCWNSVKTVTNVGSGIYRNCTFFTQLLNMIRRHRKSRRPIFNASSMVIQRLAFLCFSVIDMRDKAINDSQYFLSLIKSSSLKYKDELKDDDDDLS